MNHPGFFERSGPLTSGEIAGEVQGELVGPDDRLISDVTTLQSAGPDDASFLSNRRYMKDLIETKAGLCLVDRTSAERVPSATAAVIVAEPYHAFAQMLAMFYPASFHPRVCEDQSEAIARTARLEAGVVVEPGAIIGPEAEIGAGTRISAGAVIGYRCTIGRECYIGPRVCLTHTLVGNRVNIHAGASIGQDGFGFAMSPKGHAKVPQIGRVVIQDDVEIGANTTIDRGALKDTIIGEGTKIDNLVQIGHNVVMGRHCVIVAGTGIAGSCELGNFVVMGGKSGTAGHITIGDGAMVAGASHPIKDVPPGARMGGTPARQHRQWLRELALLRRLTERG